MSDSLEANSFSDNSKLENIKISKTPVLLLSDLILSDIIKLLKKYQLTLHILEKNRPICGSYWGDSEAGLIESTLFVRVDTPIHSILHEACHYICMDQTRRNMIDTNAEGDYDEENAVCYLQILLANIIPNFSSLRMMQDMDSWGYTFRLGSAQAWFEQDADDALFWLQKKQLLNSNNQPNYDLRDK